MKFCDCFPLLIEERVVERPRASEFETETVTIANDYKSQSYAGPGKYQLIQIAAPAFNDSAMIDSHEIR